MPRREPSGAHRARPTLEEVGRAAGVSRSTTSRVLNDHPSVRPEVRARVLQVMDEIGYVPDRVARSLRAGRTGIIGLVIPQSPPTVFGDAYFAALVTAVVGAGQDRGCTVATVLVDEVLTPAPPATRDDVRSAPAELVQGLAGGRLLDGVVITASVVEDHLPRALRTAGVPVVVIGEPADPAVPSVDVDNDAGGRLAVEHLVAVGRRRLVVLAGPASNASARRRRQSAIVAARRAGAQVVDEVTATDFSEAAGAQAMHAVLERTARGDVDGLVAGSDALAVGAMAAMAGAGRTVPDDIAVVGFDDLPPARLATPPLTTVAQSIEEVGRMAVRRLLAVVDDDPSEAAVHRAILDVHLVVRASTPAGAGRRGDGRD